MKRIDEGARLFELTSFEREYWGSSAMVGGMDEVGRGPLAGPVFAACVVMPSDPLVKYVNDSKKLSSAKREAVYEEILDHAEHIGIGFATQEEIDEINILEATKLAFKRAYENMKYEVDSVLVDAVKDLEIAARQVPIIHGDALSYSIAAASIVAKVERDALMTSLSEKYPQYGFERNKGYGTPEHIAALRKYGPCPLHRRSFIKNFTGEM